MRTPSPWEAMARARPISPFTLMASWGQAGRHWPQRIQLSSSIWSSWGSSATMTTASVGQTRTQAKEATHSSASMTKFKDVNPSGGGQPLQFDVPRPQCQGARGCKVNGQFDLQECIILQLAGSL